MNELKQYKHYFIGIAALLVANYITVPLWDYATEQQGKNILLERRLSKTELLLTKQEDFGALKYSTEAEYAKLKEQLFVAPNEATFKLKVQQRIEDILTKNECNLVQIDWKGATEITSTIVKWQLELRYNGNSACAITTSRTIESAKPMLQIEEYVYGARVINESPSNKVTGIIRLNIFHLLEAKAAKNISEASA